MSIVQSNDDDELMMKWFLQSLSRPEEELLPLFLLDNNNNDSISLRTSRRQEQLRNVCRILFGQIEKLAKLYHNTVVVVNNNDNNNESASAAAGCASGGSLLSGLDELFVGGSGGDGDDEGGTTAITVAASSSPPCDAETLWGQVELQNKALYALVKRNLKKLIQTVEESSSSQQGQGQHDQVRLLDMEDIMSDDDRESGSVEEDDDDSSNDDSESDHESDDEDDDDETKRIRARMERAMQDMEESDDVEVDGDDEVEESTRQDKDDDDEESLEDPAAEELNDGFFDIEEMEAFADEEEDYLPEDAFGTVQPDEQEELEEPKKSFHQRQRDGDIESGTDDDDDDDEPAFNAFENPVKRRKYRDDSEIEALYKLYLKTPEADDEDDDSVINMTAAEFFGKPNKKYFEKWNSKKSQQRESRSDVNDGDDDDADSWDNHDFHDDPGWRDTEESKPKKVTFANTAIDESTDGGRDEEDVEETFAEKGDEENTTLSSSHARRAEKLRCQTEQIEKELLAEKPWQMTGETSGTSRPVNSLLEATPEFEVATKMAPLITFEHTANLEDVIKRRILDEDWDDVVPRELPDIGWNKKRGELPEVSQEKSKLGLGELYEREYLKKAAGYDVDAVEKQSDEDKARSEMKALFANLCSKLDALSNYNFAPRPVADEAEVRPVTTPAIAMEEVLPLHVSDARGVAPEEVYGKKKGRDGVLRGDTELDQTERRRLRNAKKAARRKARKAKLADEKLLSRLQPGLGLNNPYEKRKMREELSMARSQGKVSAGMRDSSADYGTSGKFFKRMQEEVEQAVHQGDTKKRKTDSGVTRTKSSAFKL